MLKLFKKLTAFNAAEASVISFLLMSLIGGSLLYYTESDRMVQAKEPVVMAVTVTPTEELGDSINGEATEQMHTFVQKIEYKGERFIDTLFTAVSALV